MNAKKAKRLRRISKALTQDQSDTAYIITEGTIQLRGMTTRSFYQSFKKKITGEHA